jgi:hypothetical protein
MGHLTYGGGYSPFNLCLHDFFLFFKSLPHPLMSFLLFALSSFSSAASIRGKVSLEREFP